jgi:transcriptional regulator
MYSVPYFRENDRREVMQFLHDHPFITLCGGDSSGKPVATHVPVLIKEKDGHLYLQGHVMKQSDHHNAFIHNPNVLAIFSGSHTYVSASWYSNKQQASTWNYVTVHAHGTLSFLDEASLLRILNEITTRFENNADSPASFSKLPAGYVNQLSKAIIAFEIRVDKLENVFKLSQNRDEESYHAIIDQLNRQDADAREIAREMLRRAEQLFGKKGKE